MSEKGFSVLMTVGDLQAKLATICSGAHLWSVELVNLEPGEEGSTRLYAHMWYSNPGTTDMPNQLCFGFPLLQDSFWLETESYVCLHPSLAVPVQAGLYFEGDRLLRDPLEDFDRFWAPIRKVLS